MLGIAEDALGKNDMYTIKIRRWHGNGWIARNGKLHFRHATTAFFASHISNLRNIASPRRARRRNCRSSTLFTQKSMAANHFWWLKMHATIIWIWDIMALTGWEHSLNARWYARCNYHQKWLLISKCYHTGLDTIVVQAAALRRWPAPSMGP